MAKRARPGPQGLSNLNTWRLPFSEDVKRRRQQKREQRRPHRVRAGDRPDSVLGTVTPHWTDVPKADGKTKAIHSAHPKRRGGHPQHEPGFFARPKTLSRRRSSRRARRQP
jgi:hypothetical protein